MVGLRFTFERRWTERCLDIFTEPTQSPTRCDCTVRDGGTGVAQFTHHADSDAEGGDAAGRRHEVNPTGARTERHGTSRRDVSDGMPPTSPGDRDARWPLRCPFVGRIKCFPSDVPRRRS